MEWSAASAWQSRGLIEPGASPTLDDLQAMCANSWFHRRNRRFTHTITAARHCSDPMQLGKDEGWVARRHRTEERRQRRGAKRAGAAAPADWQWHSATKGPLLEALQARLPRGVRPVDAEPAVPLRLNFDSPLTAERSAGTFAAAARSEVGTPVYLNLYDLCSCGPWGCSAGLHWCGVGIYHSGVEICRDGVEFTFDNHTGEGEGSAGEAASGVVAHSPYHADPRRRRELPPRAQILLGRSQLSERDCREKLQRLAIAWPSHSYDILAHNCHDWCEEAAAALGVSRLPRWVNRSARLMLFCSGTPIGGPKLAPTATRARARDGGGRPSNRAKQSKSPPPRTAFRQRQREPAPLPDSPASAGDVELECRRPLLARPMTPSMSPSRMV